MPIFVKIAPDLDEAQVDTIAATLRRHRMDGVVATNTTVSRDAVKGLPHAEEAGGLSGAPVATLTSTLLDRISGTYRSFPRLTSTATGWSTSCSPIPS